MRKMMLLFLVFFMFNFNSFAMNPADGLNKVPYNFKWECYENYNKIDKSEVRDNKTNEKYETYKINVPKTEDLVITQFWFIIPYKFYTSENEIYDYKSNLWSNNSYLQDYNFDTSLDLNSKNENEIILDFNEEVKENSFSFNFKYSSNNYPEYYISSDWKNWDKIRRSDIEDFSFNYLKINFVSKTDEQYLEKIKIYELNLTKKTNTILVRSQYNENIEIYSQYNCKSKDFSTKALPYNEFNIDNETKTITLELQKNPKYDVYSKKDYDNDWIEDEIDNCKYRYNPNQKDWDWDWIWDMCSDIDWDGKIWYYDNCPYISNRDQKDINNNNVWDACEFDKDEDWIYDSIDNCITIKNSKQEDDDLDWIWNACDNCALHNPSQLDKNNNWIWDFCEEEKTYKEENDEDSDWVLNYLDNCIDISNPNQEDKDNDGIWNACDNCKEIKNKDQKDLDENWVWDFCEDIDFDWIAWYLDNCIYLENSEQKDDDNNWVWNACEDKDNDNIWFLNDNCPYKYNPEQKDIDNDNIWDKCDENDDRYIESNNWFFIWLLIFITIIFWSAIFYTIRKIK
jgi:hypothetical protein